VTDVVVKTSPPSPLLSLRVFYFLTFSALGSLFPFLPLLLESRGLDPPQISWVMVLIPIANLFVPPLWGTLADKLGARLRLLRWASLGCAGGVLLLLPAWGFVGSLLAVGAFACFRAPIPPLADAATSAALGKGRLSFGRVRVWGSVGFASLVLSVGLLQGSLHPRLLLGIASVLYLGSALSLARVTAPQTPARRAVIRQSLGVITHPPILLFLMGSALYYAGHSTYDVYFGLYARALGHSDRFIGTAWAVGVGVEIGVMLLAPRLLRRVQSSKLLVCCAAVAAVRWLSNSLLTGWGLIPLQGLHGLTFGLWFLSLVQYVQDRAPEHLRTSLQSLAVSSMGLGMVIGYLTGGVVFHRYGGALLFRVAVGCAGCALLLYLACAMSSRVTKQQGATQG
jgi:MFS transporter, PPP family, 3-phenylpropionic acid transporter